MSGGPHVVAKGQPKTGAACLKLVFCGTPEFAVPTLEALIGCGHHVALVVTQPDRAAGRGMEMHATPVKQAAMSHGIPVAQPEKIKTNAEFQAQLESIRPDAIIVVAYGRIIPRWMLDLPPLGNINLHGSLLPKYRGAAPIQWAVANGETITGVTTMRIDEGLDTGDMLLAHAVPIAPHETAADLFTSLSATGAQLMVQTLNRLVSGNLDPQPQNHAQATLAPILTREDAAIDFTRSAQQIYDRWRGFQPWPSAYTRLRGKKLIAHRVSLSTHTDVEPGLLHVHNDQLVAGCGEGTSIQLDEVQLEGKRRMAASEFLRGFQVRSGERLGA
ncbi:MAG TPA: methionyl-tRNA formyltransferase [Acidobacteriaceae bacterium]|nr:methionyl-tRNA formyltransferase [Acidobacteriaceae bacterium]